MPRSTRWRLVVVAVALGFWACGDDSTTSPTPVTTTPTVETTTETFEGTLASNGAKTFSFTLQAAGIVTATLTSVSPDATVVVSLSLGTWNGTACQIVLANDNAVQGAILTGSASAAGSLCVRVSVGPDVQPLSFVVTVVHP